MYWFQGGYQKSKQGIVFLCFILAIVSIYAAEIRSALRPPAWQHILAASSCLMTPMMN